VSRQLVYANKDTASVIMNEELSSSLSILANDSASDGDSIYLNAVTNAATLQGGSITIDKNGNYTYTPKEDFIGQDEYTYTIRDFCGYTAKAKIIINVAKKKTLFIPEGFSPNGDGSHDLFVLENVEGYQLKIKVFNRWGALVYENNDYKAPDWWDGSANTGLVIGDRLPDGTYFYEIETNTGDKFVRYLTLKR
ncbi:MAG TPA: gliding motility-associated C-terminal domain-containing protein, partial [Cytophagaceae bacterium]|nr:gliding motility-associated C-terminal domain-containing protein [Cytophagaceae bacterium]